MIDLSPHQTWDKSVPNSENLWRNGYPKGYKWEISYESSVPAAHAEYSATNVTPSVGAVAAVKRLSSHISQFAPYISRRGGSKNQLPLV